VTPAITTARAAYLDAVRARLDADAAVVTAAVAWRRAERAGEPIYAEREAWDYAMVARMRAAGDEDRASTAYERELYDATYGYGGRP